VTTRFPRSCGNAFETGSTLGHDLQIEVCSACHPFYTGKQKIVDTAGRLQNKSELMDELAKIRRVLGRLNPASPHDVVLVLDATTGQNALSQIEIFKEVAGVTGLVMTKLDGSARGGVLVAAAEKFGLPIHAIGVGETIEDLRPFDPAELAHIIAGADKA
jgi:fused signal recognition particle receptor